MSGFFHMTGYMPESVLGNEYAVIARYVGLFSYDFIPSVAMLTKDVLIPRVIARYVGLFSYDLMTMALSSVIRPVIARYVGLFSYDEDGNKSAEYIYNNGKCDCPLCRAFFI